MAKKTVTYKEPKSYFNADMKKAAKKWESENREKKKTSSKSSGQKK